MTFGEVRRAAKAYQWQQQNKAFFDYQLANLIGISVGRCLSNKVELPDIEDVYPALFEKEKIQAQVDKAETQKQVAGFLALAEKHNANYKRGDDLSQKNTL